MGHLSCRERDEFTDLKEDAGKNRTYHIYNHCNNAYRASRPTAEGVHRATRPIFKLAQLQNQQFVRLVQCILKLPAQRQCAHAMTTHLQLAVRKDRNGSTSFFTGPSHEAEGEIFMRLIVEFQADNRLPDSFIERLSTVRLLRHVSKMIADIFPLPSRKKLGGPILEAYALDCESHDSTALREGQGEDEGARVNFLSDIWQNISRAHLLGCQLVLFGCGMTYALLPTGSRHDGIAIAEQMESVMEKMMSDGWSVVTDSAGQCGRARRILSLRWPQISFQICFAHDLNNLVKAVLKSDFSVVTKQASDAVNALNASSAKWLV